MDYNVKYVSSIIEDKKKDYTKDLEYTKESLKNLKELKSYLEQYTKKTIDRKFYSLYGLIEQRINWEYINFEVQKETRFYIKEKYYIYISRDCTLSIPSRDRVEILERVRKEEKTLEERMQNEKEKLEELEKIDSVLLNELIEKFKKEIPDVIFYEVKKSL